ncbi:proton-conducting transporter membrane subunit [Limisphaera sp. 4302-co]|uniref:proton-conducting transporter transmembrane domain-containing protein n=1 Tax=Limisphaera sp. 4302-co TaxID=3400417 RepID=UPI003C262930
MEWLLLAFFLWMGSGSAAWLLSRWRALSSHIAAAGTVIAATLAALPALRVLAAGDALSFVRPWSVPFGEFALRLDALSAWFVLVIVLVSALSAVYGVQYLASTPTGKSLGPSWFFFNLLVASMVLVVVAANAVLFLVAWEVMALASFFLVTFEDEKEAVREAGWVYLVATHLGAAFLLAFFLITARETGTMDFARWAEAGIHSPQLAGVLFVLALVGFGSKAGFMPLHVWLPEAHPAAPSHVSALMSGVMIKTGIYGLLRALTFLGTPPVWWGWVLVGVGLSSGILGVLFALAQRDLKRLLAYSSVENLGIITLGLGVGLLGVSLDLPALMVLGLGGGLLHVLNHALFKSLLFMGAGSVLHATGTRDLEHLGGLLKKMPWTGVTFVIGAAAICGLPPFNGFVSELLVYLGAFHGGNAAAQAAFPGWLVIGGLALIGGLATACFTRAFGIVFLGEPRTEHAGHAHECGPSMRWPMVLLAAACLAVGLGAPVVLRGVAPAIGALTGLNAEQVATPLTRAGGWLQPVTVVALILIALAIGLTALRRRLLAGREVGEAGTWDCGYTRPTARMQYTASSFARPLTSLFAPLLRTHEHAHAPEGLFPKHGSLATHTEDVFQEGFYAPLFRAVRSGLGRLRRLQQGTVQLYILYLALALLALLIWKLR